MDVTTCVCVCECVRFDKPVLIEKERFDYHIWRFWLVHHCVSLTLLSPAKIYAFRHIDKETESELKKTQVRRGRGKGRGERGGMFIRSQAGVRWKTLLNYITVAFQFWPTWHRALFPLCVSVSGVPNTCGFHWSATFSIMMLVWGSFPGSRWRNIVVQSRLRVDLIYMRDSRLEVSHQKFSGS